MSDVLTLSIPLFASLVSACIAGFIMLTYEAFATKNGWAIGKFYRNDLSRIIGGLSIIGAVGFAVLNLSILYGLAVFVTGFIFGLILSSIWKTYVQWIAFILLIGSWVLQFYI